MNKSVVVGLLIMAICCIQGMYAKSLSDYVNPLIGTAAKTSGGVLPSVVVPFGKTHFSPMTEQNHIGCPPYYYERNQLIGFIASHQSAVWMGDFGDVVFFPTVGEPTICPEDQKLWFSHADELSRPYYYRVKTQTIDKKSNIVAEMVCDANSGIFRFSYDQGSEQGLMIEVSRELGAAGYVKIDTVRNEVYGYNPDRQDAYLGPPLENFKSHFIIRFNKKIKHFGIWDRTGKQPGRVLGKEEVLGVFLTFDSKDSRPLEVRFSNSFIDLNQARDNMARELEGVSFDALKYSGKERWNELLGRVQVKHVPDSVKTMVYTALYHTLLFPRVMSEYGRYYSAFDDQVHEGELYSTYSLWDTFRALHPLLILMVPERVDSMINSLLCMYKEGGWLPKWPNPTYTSIMIGTHADAVIADAYVKGFRGYDVELAYEAVRKNAFQPPYGDSGGDKYYVGDAWHNQKPEFRPADAGNYWWDRAYWNGGYEARGGLTWYMKYGFVPVDYASESVSRTVEFSIDDYCIAQMAKDLGRDDDYELLMERSRYYKNLYNPATGRLAPRYHDGRWFENPESGFTEGSSWTYLFGAMHDVPGMIEMMGMKDFSRLLDQNFNEKHYRHDNEPGHHYIYLYNWIGEAYKTQELARSQSRENYNANPAWGINGNDDLGQMSAWYIFTSLGFYPVAPASGEYAIGAPQYPEISINMGGDTAKKLTVKAKNLSEENKYVKGVTINGKRLTKPILLHDDIKNGGEIIFEMTDKPAQFGNQKSEEL